MAVMAGILRHARCKGCHMLGLAQVYSFITTVGDLKEC